MYFYYTIVYCEPTWKMLYLLISTEIISFLRTEVMMKSHNFLICSLMKTFPPKIVNGLLNVNIFKLLMIDGTSWTKNNSVQIMGYPVSSEGTNFIFINIVTRWWNKASPIEVQCKIVCFKTCTITYFSLKFAKVEMQSMCSENFILRNCTCV